MARVANKKHDSILFLQRDQFGPHCLHCPHSVYCLYCLRCIRCVHSLNFLHCVSRLHCLHCIPCLYCVHSIVSIIYIIITFTSIHRLIPIYVRCTNITSPLLLCPCFINICFNPFTILSHCYLS